MFTRLLPLFAAVAPLLAVTFAHWLGVRENLLPACVPYFEGCTSISATGRHPPGSFVFRATLLPLTTVLAVIWYFVFAWLENSGEKPNRNVRTTLLLAGVSGAVALLIYVTFLGTREPIYEFMRRFGIYVYFLGTITAQLLTSSLVYTYSNAREDPVLRRIAYGMFSLCLLPFALGVLNLTLKTVLDDSGPAENRIEWLASLMMHGWFVLLYFGWRASDFSVSVNGLDQRASLRTRSSVSDSRNATRSARSASDKSKPRTNSDL